ncbi:MAG: helix-turn-helix domain-containing protein [Bauldia sp.]
MRRPARGGLPLVRSPRLLTGVEIQRLADDLGELKRRVAGLSGEVGKLRDRLRPPQGVEALHAKARPAIGTIQRVVAAHYGIDPLEFVSQRRGRMTAMARRIAIYLARHMTVASLPEIGRAFGGRDHSSVFHAIRRLERLMLADPALAVEVSELRQAVIARAGDAVYFSSVGKGEAPLPTSAPNEPTGTAEPEAGR